MNDKCHEVDAGWDMASGGYIRIDGEDIKHVTGVAIYLKPEGPPEVVLDLYSPDVHSFNKECIIEFSPKTKELLFEQGWTPPPGD